MLLYASVNNPSSGSLLLCFSKVMFVKIVSYEFSAVVWLHNYRTEFITTYFYWLFFSKIVPFTRKCGKNSVQRSRPRMTTCRKSIACWIPKATNTHTQTHTHTHKLCNTHCFSTATMVARTRLNVTLYVQCLACYLYKGNIMILNRFFNKPKTGNIKRFSFGDSFDREQR
jgi:hypothetical protein